MQGVLDFDNSSGSGDDDYISQPGAPVGWDMQTPPDRVQIPSQTFDPNIGPFGTPPYSAPMNQQEFTFSDVSALPLSASHTSLNDSHTLNVPTNSSLSRPESTWSGDQYNTNDLSEILGELKINENGVGK